MKTKYLNFTVASALICAASFAHAEGSDQVGANQGLKAGVPMLLDVLDHTTENISWTGDGQLIVTTPSGTSATLASGTTFDTTENGVYGVENDTEQSGAWDVGLTGVASTSGRLSSLRWRFGTGSYEESRSLGSSVYAVVPGGVAGQGAVVEMKTNGLSGFEYALSANQSGLDGLDAGRSALRANATFAPEYRIYFNPPEAASYSFTPPVLTGVNHDDGTSLCQTLQEGVGGTFYYDSNIEGNAQLVCDFNGDGVYDRGSSTDGSILQRAGTGSNTIQWNGEDNSGTVVGAGTYQCVIELQVGSFHYIAEDIETSYLGLQMYYVDNNGQRSPLNMFWNDQEVQANAEPMPNGAISLENPGFSGVLSGPYASIPTPNTNARSWGQFDSESKGNEAYLDTYTNIETAQSAPISITIVDSGDTDGDQVTDWEEICSWGSNPNDPNNCGDRDGDTCDDCSVTAGPPATSNDGADTDGDSICNAGDDDSDNDGIPDMVDIDDDNDGILDIDEGNGSVDTDGDGVVDSLDLDSDNDGLLDAQEAGYDYPVVCGGYGANGFCDALETTPESGVADYDGNGQGSDQPVDTDGDGVPDFRDLDSDNDGIVDLDEAGSNCLDRAPTDAVCDGPVDGFGNPASGEIVPDDFDGDGVPNHLDLDSDNDGTVDLTEGGSNCVDSNRNGVCDGPDADGDGIVDSIDDDDAAFGDPGSPAPADSDDDGAPDYTDLDSNNDGTPDAVNCVDADNDGVCEGTDTDGDGVLDDVDGFNGFGITPLGDHDGDGINNIVDLDDDNDGITDIEEGDGNVDTDGDGVPDSFDIDSDNDGLFDAQEAGHGLVADSGLIDCGSGFGANGLCDDVETGLESGVTTDAVDSDSDGTADFRDLDSDDDNIYDSDEADTDCFGACSGADTDGDGLVDSQDNASGFGSSGATAPTDTDGDDTPDYLDLDTDGDNIADINEAGDDNPDTRPVDTDGDGVPDYRDLDSDDDGIPDIDEPTDKDGNGQPDFKEATNWGVAGGACSSQSPLAPIGMLIVFMMVGRRKF